MQSPDCGEEDNLATTDRTLSGWRLFYGKWARNQGMEHEPAVPQGRRVTASCTARRKEIIPRYSTLTRPHLEYCIQFLTSPNTGKTLINWIEHRKRPPRCSGDWSMWKFPHRTEPEGPGLTSQLSLLWAGSWTSVLWNCPILWSPKNSTLCQPQVLSVPRHKVFSYWQPGCILWLRRDGTELNTKERFSESKESHFSSASWDFLPFMELFLNFEVFLASP